MRQVERSDGNSVVENGAAALDPKLVQGMKWLRQLRGLRQRLQEAGCERDRAGNRELHFSRSASLTPSCCGR
jgi:hypothetical protein